MASAVLALILLISLIAVVATIVIAFQVYHGQQQMSRIQETRDTIQCLQKHIEVLEGAKPSPSGKAEDPSSKCEFKQPATESK